jgi:hypothetical protein
VVSDLSSDQAMRLVYYRNGSYLTANGRFPGRWIADKLRHWVRPARRGVTAG